MMSLLNQMRDVHVIYVQCNLYKISNIKLSSGSVLKDTLVVTTRTRLENGTIRTPHYTFYNFTSYLLRNTS